MFRESFWVFVSFVIFIGAIFKPVKAIVLKMLDERAAKIAHELEEASKLKKEAQDMLKEIRSEHHNIQQTAKDIIDKAHVESQTILEEAKSHALRITKKRMELAMQRIAQQEEQIIRDIKNEAIDLALGTVQRMLLDEVDKNTKLALIDDSINSLKKFVH